eukprot:74074_1
MKRKFYPTYDPFPRLTIHNESVIPTQLCHPSHNNEDNENTTGTEDTVSATQLLSAPILKEFNDRLSSVPPVTKPVTSMTKKSEYKWFQDVFMEWHPPKNKGYEKSYDKAFAKWYNHAMSKDITELSHPSKLRRHILSDA